MSEAIKLDDLNLDITPSCAMDYNDPVIELVGNHLVVGYLADDELCENPLEDCDGMGRIYSYYSNAGKSEHRLMQEALGLNADWAPDIETEEVEALAEKALRVIIKREFTSEFIAFALECGSVERAWAEFIEDFKNEDCDLDFTDLDFTRTVGNKIKSWKDICEDVWRDALQKGSIGDPYAVRLDCYQHGGTVWSIIGEGIQCDFDTASGAGVWVPDDCAREEARRREKVYAFGRIFQLRGPTPWHAILDGQEQSSPGFKKWHEAYDWLEQHKPEREPTADELFIGRGRAAENLAREALETYNAWLSGECYGTVVATFTNTAGLGEDPEWELVSSDECWGYIGAEYAMEEVVREVASTVKRIEASDPQMRLAA